LKELIAQLDVPLRQVHVEAIIMQVVLNDAFSLGVETTGLTANDAFALNNVVGLANILASGPLAAAGNGITAGILDGTTQITLPGAAGGAPVVQEIPNVPLLIQALESMTDLEVLSQPSLTTVDNTEANFVEGSNVPFPVGQSRSIDQSTVIGGIFNNRIDREDVGIKMDVKPQITEGDYVNMELKVNVSQVAQSPAGIDPNVLGPTFAKSEINNNMVIKDGGLGVMGGLMSETTDRSIHQPPIFGDIPMLGWLFRRKSDTRNKRNLVVLISPHVVKESGDMDRMTQFRVDEFVQANLDVLFEKGFIRKIKRRHERRDDFHPTAAKAQQVLEGQGYGRGDLKR
ncbi:MAG: hypothetical protein HY706_17590, partial [Candidatus Hydrogenedentes bacterium]|nr:hypothetical protein [Candidatus Hydrogenedentota bacterium]